MIGVAIPAHDEEERLSACVASVLRAACHPALAGERVEVVVVLDACRDRSFEAAARHPVEILSIEARNVGRARALGADALLESRARWLTFTDADTIVSRDWLAAQLALDADAVCGTVGVAGWWLHPLELRERYRARYMDADGHRHVHGANLGVAAEWYRRVGGFASLPAHEDVALVDALERAGARIAWSAAPRVVTSARRDARARGGFGDHLLALAAGHGVNA